MVLISAAISLFLSVREFFEFVQGILEFLHCRFKRRLRGEVHSRLFENGDGVGAIASRKELKVILDGFISLRQNPFDDGNGGNNSRGIFVDVEGTIEVRNPRPFVSNFLIVNDPRAVILLIELVLDFAEILLRKRLARLRFRVGDLFEFRKLRLAEQRRTDHIDIVIEEILLQILVLSRRIQIFHEQNFVDRAGDFREEYRIFRLGIRLP